MKVTLANLSTTEPRRVRLIEASNATTDITGVTGAITAESTGFSVCLAPFVNLTPSCTWRTLDQINAYVSQWSSLLNGTPGVNVGGIYSIVGPDSTLETQPQLLADIDRIMGAKLYAYYNPDLGLTGEVGPTVSYLGTADFSSYIPAFRQNAIDHFQDWVDNWGYIDYMPFGPKAAVSSLPADVQAIIAAADAKVGDGISSQTADIYLSVSSYWRTPSTTGVAVNVFAFNISLRAYSPQRTGRVAWIDTIAETCYHVDSTQPGYTAYNSRMGNEPAVSANDYVAGNYSAGVIINGVNTVSGVSLSNGGSLGYG